MEQERAAALAAENMKTIFAYSLSRVSHKEDAEDLCSDIIVAILAGAERLRDDDAFFGYIWAIAANTYKKFLRKKNRGDFTGLGEEIQANEDFEREILDLEDVITLRRELALLSREYRECTVAYYVDGLSCSETASKLGISLEMVKYYLFKTRKLLKEGIGMDKNKNTLLEFGEKSYRPSKLEFVTIFSGKYNAEYRNLFNRKLPGNILLSAYYTPMTIRELSVELGIASAYMEDEIALLEKYNLITQISGGKYQTNLVIFTEDYTREFYRRVSGFCAEKTGEIIKGVKDKLLKIRDIGFRGNKLEEQRMLWPLLWMVMHSGNLLFKSSEDKKPDVIYDGATGINYGIHREDEKNGDTKDYECEAFAGYAGIDEHYAASFADFGVFPGKNKYVYNVRIVKDALYSGSEEYMVLSAKDLYKVKEILKPQIENMALLYNEVKCCAVELMKVHAPKHIGYLIDKIVSQTIFFRTVGMFGKCAVLSGELTVSDYDKPIAVFIYETTTQDKVSVTEGVQV